MRKLVLPLFVFLCANAFGDQYHLATIAIPDRTAAEALAGIGLSLEEGVHWTDAGVEIVVSDTELRAIRKAGLLANVIRADMESYFRSRLVAEQVDAFAQGSMGGFYTYSEVMEKLREYRRRYPNLISNPETIGTSLEGRAIVAVKISDNPGADEDGEPEVLYTSLHHAREPQGLMCVLYFMERILKKYGKDPEITYLIDHRQLWFVPVVNPDGYVFNEQSSPEGGGLWRKNRRQNANGSIGVDLNRNYGFMWGVDDIGSSPDPVSETYRGTGPFSERETVVMRDFVSRHKFALALNYHAHSNLLIYPWGFQAKRTPDHSKFRKFSKKLTEKNGYRTGLAVETVGYFVNGDSDDWMYGDNSKPEILAMTPEVGSRLDNFWPPRNRIVPLAKENYQANLYLAWMAGGLPAVKKVKWQEMEGNGDSLVQQGEKHKLIVTLWNLGLNNVIPEVTVSFKQHPNVEVRSVFSGLGDIKPFRRKRTTFEVEFSQKASAGKTNLQLLIYSQGKLLRKETIAITIH